MKTFIVIGWQCWGRGETIKAAKAKCLKECSREARKDNFYAYMFDDPEAYVCDSGSFKYKGACERLGQI